MSSTPNLPSPPVSQPTQRATYSERLVPGLGVWSAIAVFALFVYIMLVVVDPGTAAVSAVGTLVVGVVGAWLASPVITVDATTLRVDKAHIPTNLLGEITRLDRAGIHTAMGPAYDPRSFTCLRMGTGYALWLPVLDESDPTPGWLVSTRHPDRLTEAIAAARS